MCFHWSVDGKCCLFCGASVPEQSRARAKEVVARTIKSESFTSEPSSLNELMLETAIEFLHDINSEEIETIQINSTKHDDRSRSIKIEITYPPELTEFEKQAKEVWDRLKSNIEQ